MEITNIGFGNVVVSSRVIAVVDPKSTPLKRLIEGARDAGYLIDATYGRTTRAAIITDSNHIVLSPTSPETLADRIFEGEKTKG